jgi:hypothetical protein
LPSRINIPILIRHDEIDLFNEISDVRVLLRLRSKRTIPFNELEEQPEYDQILKEALQTLILHGTAVKLRFHQTKNKLFPLHPSIEYEETENNIMSKFNLSFWPNIELDTEDKLKRCIECKWEAIIISHSRLN